MTQKSETFHSIFLLSWLF